MATLNITINSGSIDASLSAIETKVTESATRIRSIFASATSGTPSQNITSMNNALDNVGRAAAAASSSTGLLEKAFKESAGTTVQYQNALVNLSDKYGENDAQVRRWLPNLKSAEEAIRRQSMAMDGQRESMGKSADIGDKFNETISRTAVMNAELAGKIKYTSDGFQSLYSNAGAAEKTVSLYQNAVAGASLKTAAYGQAVTDLGLSYGKSNAAVSRWLPMLNAAESAILKQSKAMEGAGRSGTAFYDSANRVAIINAEMSGRIKYTSDGFQSMSEKAQIARGSMKEVGDATEATSSSFLKMIPHVAAVTASYMAMRAVFSGFTSMIGEVAKFDFEMARVGAATGAAGAELEKMGNAAREAAKDSIYMASEAAAAMKELVFAGFSATEAMEALPNVLKLATIEQMGLAKATEFSVNILNSFSLSTAEFARVNDVLATTSAKTSTNLTQMGQAMKYAAPAGAQLGYSIEQVSAMLGVMAQAGIKGGQAGRVLQQAFVKTSDVAKTLGMDMNSSLIDVLTEVEAKGYSVSSMAKMFGQVALKGILALKSNTEGYKELLDANMNANGAMDKMVNSIETALIPQLEKLKAVTGDVAIGIYNNFKDQILASVVSLKENLEGSSGSIVSFSTSFISAISAVSGPVVDLGKDLLALHLLIKAGIGLQAFAESAMIAGTGSIALHSALVKLRSQLTLTNLGLTEASVAATAASGKASVLSVGLVGVASAAALVIGWNIGHWLRELYVNAKEAAKQVDILSQKMQVMVSTSAKTVSLIEGVKSGFIGEKYFTNNISQFEKKIQELKQLQNEMSLEDIYKEDSKYYVYKDQINEYTESIKNLNYVQTVMFSGNKDSIASFEKLDSSLVETARKTASLSGVSVQYLEDLKKLEAYKKSIIDSEKYQKVESDRGIEEAQKYLAVMESLYKKDAKAEIKTGLKDAAAEAKEAERTLKEYNTVLTQATDEYNRLTMSADDYAKLKVWEWWKKESGVIGVNNQYLNEARDLKLKEIDATGKQATAMKELDLQYAEATMSKEAFAEYKLDAQFDKDSASAIQLGFAYKIASASGMNYLDVLKMILEQNKKNNDESSAKKALEDAEALTTKQASAYRTIYKDLQKYSGDYYQTEILSLNKQKTELEKTLLSGKTSYQEYFDYKTSLNLKDIMSYEEYTKAKQALDDWYIAQKQAKDDEQLLKTGTFFDGLGVAYRKSQEDLLTWGKAGEKVFQDLQKAGTTALSDGLFKTLKGEMNGFEDAWKGFCDTLLKTFTDMIAQMVIQDLFKMVFGGNGTINIIGSGTGAATGSSDGGLLGGLSTLASLAGIAKFLYNLPATVMALPAQIAAIPGTLTNMANVFTSMFSGTAGPGVDMADIAAEITKQLAGEAVKVGAEAGAQAGVQAGVEIGAEMGVGGGAQVGSLSMGWIGAIISIGAAIGDFMLKQTNGPTMEQMDALLRAEEAGQVTLTKENRDIYKGILLSQNFTMSLDGVNTTFAGTTESLDAWIASNQELLTMTMAEYDQLMGMQQAVWNEILTGDGTDATVYSPMGVGYHTESSGTITIALEMADESLSLEKRMYNLGFVGTQNGWESSAVVAMLAEFKDQGVPWESINDALIAYGVTDSDVYKRIYGEYTDTNMGNLSWDEFQTALIATGLDTTTIKRLESIYSSDISYDDFMSLLNATGLDANTILQIQAAVDPSSRWTDLEIPVDTSGIPDFIPIGQPIGGRATGGPVAANTPYIVGEIGPELFVPQESGHILSNANMKKLLGMGVQGFADGTTDPAPFSDEWYAKYFPWQSDPDYEEPSTGSSTSTTQTLEEWFAAYTKELAKMLGTTSELGDALATINDYYTEQTKTATELGATSETLAQLLIDQESAKKKAIEDWLQTETDYYNEMMGLNTELGTSLSEIQKHYDEAAKSAKAAGASEADLAAITEIAMAVKKKAEENYWKDALDYYNEMMGLTSGLQSSLDAANAKFNEYAKAAEGNAEKLAAIEKARGEVLAKLYQEWLAALVKPFADLAASMEDWYRGLSGRIGTVDANGNPVIGQGETGIAQSIRHLKDAGYNKPISASEITTKYAGLNPEEADKYAAALQEYFTSISDALMAAYESLKTTRDSINQDIEDIRKSALTSEELRKEYANKLSVQNTESWKWAYNNTDSENQSTMAAQAHTVIMDYYNSEMTALKTKHETEIANITAVRDKLKSLMYSSFNLALPSAKQATSAQDYEKLYAAAKSPGASSNDVSSYLSFADTYLQSSQDKYKSSDAYQNIYKKVMAEIGSIDTKPGVSIEDLTNDQTVEITKLNSDVTAALGALGTLTETSMGSVITKLIDIYGILKGIGDLLEPDKNPDRSSEMLGADNAISLLKVNEILSNDAVRQTDAMFGVVDPKTGERPGTVSIAELLLFYGNATAVWQNKLYEGLILWAGAELLALDGLKGGSMSTAQFKDMATNPGIANDDGIITVAEIMTYYYLLFYNQAKEHHTDLEKWILNLARLMAIPTENNERLLKSGADINDDKFVSLFELTFYYFEFFRAYLKDIELNTHSSGISEATKNDIVDTKYNVSEVLKRIKSMTDAGGSWILYVGQWVESVIKNYANYVINTLLYAFGGMSNSMNMSVSTDIEFNEKDDITAFLASWAYDQETKPVTIKTDIEFNQKDDITAFLASWAYDQETAPANIMARTYFDMRDPTTALMENWFFGGGIPTAYATIITTNIIHTVYESDPAPREIVEEKFDFPVINRWPSFADGGISYGASSGYPAMLHGTEAVIPLPNGRTLPVELKSTGSQSQADPEIKQLLRILVANQAQDKYLSVDGRQFKIYVQEQADINRVNSKRRAGNDTRRIT